MLLLLHVHAPSSCTITDRSWPLPTDLWLNHALLLLLWVHRLLLLLLWFVRLANNNRRLHSWCLLLLHRPTLLLLHLSLNYALNPDRAQLGRRRCAPHRLRNVQVGGIRRNTWIAWSLLCLSRLLWHHWPLLLLLLCVLTILDIDRLWGEALRWYLLLTGAVANATTTVNWIAVVHRLLLLLLVIDISLDSLIYLLVGNSRRRLWLNVRLRCWCLLLWGWRWR